MTAPSWRLGDEGAIRQRFERFYERLPEANFQANNIFVSNPLALTANNEVAVKWTANIDSAK